MNFLIPFIIFSSSFLYFFNSAFLVTPIPCSALKDELNIMKGIKKSIDSKNILNPGKIIDY